ncbi:hypothetical protein STANM309S_02969 [Streptomyces tanashiensis]
MGHAARNFHADLMGRMGYEKEVHRIQELFAAGRREEAVLAVPDAFAERDLARRPAGADRRTPGPMARGAR